MVESCDEDLVFGEQQVADEPIERIACIDDGLPAHTVARIEQHAQADRHALVSELGDALLDAVFEDLEVALREASDEPATGIGDRDGDLDDVDAAAERPGLSPHHGATDDTASCDGANSVVFHAATR